MGSGLYGYCDPLGHRHMQGFQVFGGFFEEDIDHLMKQALISAELLQSL